VILIHQRHRQTDGQTDRRTDGQHAISIPRYALVHRAVKSAINTGITTITTTILHNKNKDATGV